MRPAEPDAEKLIRGKIRGRRPRTAPLFLPFLVSVISGKSGIFESSIFLKNLTEMTGGVAAVRKGKLIMGV